MNKKEIFEAIDNIREKNNGHIEEKICNYMEANINEFLECYEGEENE